jgi:hypothetical protein
VVFKVRKIGIITINDYNNYGNRLQNYATQEVIKSIGFEVETIVNSPYVKKRVIERLKTADKKTYSRLIKIALNKVRKKVYITKVEQNFEKLTKARNDVFREFTKINITETSFSISPDNVPPELEGKYHRLVVGSDQVWNPFFRVESPLDFLTFAPREKRVSYSASFGISELPDEYVENYRKWLSELANISVREEAGAMIVKSLTGREATVLVDPTLMLNKEQWIAVSKRANNKTNNAYLLTYFLGSLPESKVDWIKDVAKSRGLEIVNMADISDEKHYCTGPGEFIDYIDGCSIFCTDSFHGAVFSILFEKPFIVFDRESKTLSMNSRMDTLLSKFQLECRKWENISNTKKYFEIEYSHIPKILKDERNKALNFLINAFGNEVEK